MLASAVGLSAGCSSPGTDLDEPPPTGAVVFETAGLLEVADIRSDGRRAVFINWLNERAELTEVDIATGDVRVLASNEFSVFPDAGYTESGLWFRRGREIIIEHGGTETRLEAPANENTPNRAVLVRGDTILFERGREGIYRFRPSDGLQRLLEAGAAEWSSTSGPVRLVWILSSDGDWVYDARAETVVPAPPGELISAGGSNHFVLRRDGGSILWTPEGSVVLPTAPATPLGAISEAVCGFTDDVLWAQPVDVSLPLREASRTGVLSGFDFSWPIGTGCFFADLERSPLARLDALTGALEEWSGPFVSVFETPGLSAAETGIFASPALWIDSTLFTSTRRIPVRFEDPQFSPTPTLNEVSLDAMGSGVWYDRTSGAGFRIGGGTATRAPLAPDVAWFFPRSDGQYVFQCPAEVIDLGSGLNSQQCLSGTTPEVTDLRTGAGRPIAPRPLGGPVEGWIGDSHAAWVEAAISLPTIENPVSSLYRIWVLRLNSR